MPATARCCRARPWLWGLLAGFAALSIFGLLHHEPWRDEAQAWLIARDCPDLASLLRVAGYEGHPSLWPLLLRPLARAGLPFSSAALVHLLIALAAVFLFLRNAPLARHQKALFVCGYYVAFEYNLIVRNYALCFLTLFALASIYPARFRRPMAFAALLALLANTALYGLVVAVVLAGVYALDLHRLAPAVSRRRLAAAGMLAAAGFVFCVWQLWPPADIMPPTSHSGKIKDSLFDFSLARTQFTAVSRALVGAFLPLPVEGPHFWNTRLAHAPLQTAGLLEGFPAWLRWAWGALTVCPAIVSVALLSRRTVPVLGYLAASLALLSLFFLIHGGFLRHNGFIFMLFVFWWWVGEAYGENRWSRTSWARRWLGDRARGWLLTGFLVVQAAAAAAAFYNDVRYEFSSGRSAAAFLESEGLLDDRTLIACYPSKIAGPVLAYTGRRYPAVYMVEYRRSGSFMVWNSEYMWNQVLPLATVLERVDQAAAGGDYDRVILITNTETADRAHDARYRLIASFNTTVDQQESLCVYERRAAR
jgi:hypothetical protein